jgi:hypothetical protein
MLGMSSSQMFDWSRDEYRVRETRAERERRLLKRVKSASSLDEVRRILAGPSELTIVCAEEDPADWQGDEF